MSEYDVLLEEAPASAPAAGSEYDVLLDEPAPAAKAPSAPSEYDILLDEPKPQLRPPPAWNDLVRTPEFQALPLEDQSHAVEAWKQTATEYGKQHAPDWSPDHETQLGAHTDQFQAQLEGSVKFTGVDRPYRHMARTIILDPERPGDGIQQAERDGVIPRQPREKVIAAHQAQQAIGDSKRLQQSAGGQQEGKALGVGIGRGAAFMAGALPGAKAGVIIGTAIPGLGETGIGQIGGGLIGGIIGGTITSMAYDEMLDQWGEKSDAIKSALAAAELHPNYNAAGELIAFAIPSPVGVAKGIHRFKLVAENLGKKEALKQAATYVAVSGGIGAASAPVVAALDRYKNTALDLGHEPQADLFDPKSIAANTVLAIMLGNLGVRFGKYSAGEAASIHQRGMAGQKLSPAEAEVFATINRKLASDPNSFVFEVEQATMSGEPLGGAAAARTRPNPAQPGSSRPPGAGSPPPGGAPRGTTPPPRGSQQGAAGAQTPPPRQSGPTAGAQAQRGPRAFGTAEEFRDFMDDAMARGDSAAGHEAWTINNRGAGKNWFTRWYFERMQGGNPDAEGFANSVLNARTNAEYADFVRQRKGATARNGQPSAEPGPRGQQGAGVQPRATSGKPDQRSGGVQRGRERGSVDAVPPEHAAGPLARRDEGNRQNGAPVVSRSAAELRASFSAIESDVRKLLEQAPPEIAAELSRAAVPAFTALGTIGNLLPQMPPIAAPAELPDLTAAEVGELAGVPVETAPPTKRRTTRSDGGFSEHPLVAFIQGDIGGILSKSAAKAKWGAAKFAENSELWEEAPRLADPRHNKVYRANGVTPDEAARTLIDAGLLPEGSTVHEMWQAIGEVSQSVARISGQQAAQNRTIAEQAKQLRSFERTAFKADPGEEAVNVSDLQIGDTIEVSGEVLRVTEIDPESYDVVLEDGSKFGVQEVADGKVIYAETFTPAERTIEQEPLSPIEKTPESAALPKLRSGENQGDLLANQTEDLRLVGETGVDTLRQAEDRAAAELARAEADALAEREQGRLFETPGSEAVPGATNPRARATRRRTKLTHRLQSGDVVEYNGHLREVEAVREIPSLTIESAHWIDFSDGGGVRISGRVELPVVLENGRPSQIQRQSAATAEGGTSAPEGGAVSGQETSAAAESLKRKLDSEAGGIPASIFEDLVDFGARIYRQGIDFARWAAEMVQRLGSKVAEVLHWVWRSLSGQTVRPEFRESGALFGSKRRARGAQPDALPQEERFLTTQGFWEGSADVFLKRPTFAFLGKAINKQVDLASKRLGDTTGKLKAWESRTGRAEQADAKETLSQYIDARESGRTADAARILASAQPAAADLINTIGDIVAYTGRVSTTLVQPNGRTGVEVREGKTVRALRNMGRNFWPRILKGDYEAVLRDPLSDPAKWNAMIADLIANGNATTPAEAEQFLKGGASNDVDNDFLGSLYQARSGRMPAHWYDTSLEGIESWAVKWSDIVSKIEAFGQKIRPDDKDQFEEALALTTHRPTQSFILSVQARAYNERNVGTAAKYLLDAPRLLASGLFLTNPVTIGINALSARVMNTFTYGIAATYGRNPLAMFSTKNHLDAYALGILKRDMVRLLYRDDVPGLDALKNFTNGAMKVSGYAWVENLTRVDTYLTALTFLHNGLAAVRRKPDSNAALQFMAFVKRNGYDVGAIIRENGTGEATDSFLRGTIRDTQGGYAYNQVPWWTDTPLGRFMLQFSKFSTMHTRNVMQNVLRPAFVGTEVTIKVGGRTITKRVFNVRPLIYFLTGSILGGEAINWLKQKAFGIERKDATLEEIVNAMDEDTRDGLVLLAVRALNDLITTGMLGVFGTPIQLAKDVRERTRFRNPLSPPGVSLFKNVGELVQSGWEQGQLTARDVTDFLKSSVAMYRYADAFVKEQSKNAGIAWGDAELKARQDDAAFLRAASNRYALQVDLPATRSTALGRRAKDVNTPMRQELLDALMLGDQDAAKKVVVEYLHPFPSLAEKEEKLRSLRASVAQNQPVKVGGIAGNERRIEFMAWAKQHLAAKDLARIEAIDQTYRTTAHAVGLMSLPGERDERKIIHGLEKERREKATVATPEEEAEFFERKLRPVSALRRRMEQRMRR